MNAWSKKIIYFTLICYLVVSNAASVHAFSSTQIPFNIDLSAIEMSADCHTQADDTEKKTDTACKIFCSAIGNIIVDDVIHSLSWYSAANQIVFLRQGFTMQSLAKEPHPPK